MKTANPHIVIPAKAALHTPPAAAIFTLKSRHSRESGNLGMKSSRNLSEITETERTGFPPAREWRGKVGCGWDWWNDEI
ncbi:hypothetical protein MYC81_002120 [Neisseria gonorrhoeae]|uniref:hypothetical protein n=1 Tax=Neisseria gonorrhoeae TaxID=485 RepID=UPI00046E11F8|nr:hypothetical protein [Neisseria gonorrhoeae]KLS56443.1 hypothetical protein M732_10675 [Neisseria gonorrhoeae ATL_2011_05-08]MBG9969034.1 hypothetical protein [Neisseria gonorrhoeae]MBG9973033.1 hypothetical protein [Neisseria gonorrhoeae]MBG9977014.1 hypothetical protein [Neisseria gonorrhoeae]MCF3025784.1 hypothetical protein [Neisseria gonorrhoeae]